MQGPDNTITDLQARLKAAEDALQRCDRLAVASRYAGAIMHEINNPLEALSNVVYLTKAGSDDSEQVERYMEIADAQLLRLADIARKTLRFFRDVNEGREQDLTEVLEAALTLHAQRTTHQRVEIRKNLRDPGIARVVPGEILQIFSNLLLNALDALPEEGAVLGVSIKPLSEKVHITISDNGSGIPSEIRERLFEQNRTSKAHGSGFGLWLSRNLAEKHHGTIACRTSRDAPRRGTTFRLSFPKAGSSISFPNLAQS